MRFLTVLGIIAMGFSAYAGPYLPWQKSYFFPIGAWCMPTNDDEDQLDYIDRIGKNITYWEPQSC
jgi:hypothetical protein